MKPRILIIEDTREVSESLSRFLQSRFGRVDEKPIVKIADNGEDGLKLYDEFDPHVILLDVMLPKRDGWEICTAIRARPGGELGRKKIIMMSAVYKETSDQYSALKMGANDLLAKPLNPLIVVEKVRQAFDELNSIREIALDYQKQTQSDQIVRLDETVSVDLIEGVILGSNQAKQLTPQQVRILKFLSESPHDGYRSRQELIDTIWGKYIDETTVNRAIRVLRKAIQEIGGEDKEFIELRHGKGFKLLTLD